MSQKVTRLTPHLRRLPTLSGGRENSRVVLIKVGGRLFPNREPQEMIRLGRTGASVATLELQFINIRMAPTGLRRTCVGAEFVVKTSYLPQ